MKNQDTCNPIFRQVQVYTAQVAENWGLGPFGPCSIWHSGNGYVTQTHTHTLTLTLIPTLTLTQTRTLTMNLLHSTFWKWGCHWHSHAHPNPNPNPLSHYGKWVAADLPPPPNGRPVPSESGCTPGRGVPISHSYIRPTVFGGAAWSGALNPLQKKSTKERKKQHLLERTCFSICSARTAANCVYSF